MFILNKSHSIVSYSIYHSCIQCIVYSVCLSFLCVAPPEHVALQFCHFCGSLHTWKSSSIRVKRKHKGQKSHTSKHIVSALVFFVDCVFIAQCKVNKLKHHIPGPCTVKLIFLSILHHAFLPLEPICMG